MARTAAVLLALLLASTAGAVPTFTGPVGGLNVVAVGDSINWGNGGVSGLDWTEAAVVASSAPFILGELTHRNQVIALGSAITAVDLNTHGFVLTLLVDETLNSPGPVDDVITFPATYPHNGITVLGFGPTADNILPSFSSPENGNNQTFLWGITPIPAPGAISLVMIGALLARKRYGHA